jgi:hypothetical protein
LRPILISLLLSACAASAAADILPPKQIDAPIVGRWLWKSDKGDCTETHEYLPSGVKRSQSGQETLEKRYTWAPMREASHYFVSETTIRTNGKHDCAGAVSSVGHTAQISLFMEGPDKYLTCAAIAKSTCYGAATRLK